MDTAHIAHEVLAQTFYPFLDQETNRRFQSGDYIAADKADIARSLASRAAEGKLTGALWEVTKLEQLGWRDVADLSTMTGQMVEDLLAGRTDSALAAAKGLCALNQRPLAEKVWRSVRGELRRSLTAAAWACDTETASVLGHAMSSMMAVCDRQISVSILERRAA